MAGRFANSPCGLRQRSDFFRPAFASLGTTEGTTVRRCLKVATATRHRTAQISARWNMAALIAPYEGCRISMSRTTKLRWLVDGFGGFGFGGFRRRVAAGSGAALRRVPLRCFVGRDFAPAGDLLSCLCKKVGKEAHPAFVALRAALAAQARGGPLRKLALRAQTAKRLFPPRICFARHDRGERAMGQGYAWVSRRWLRTARRKSGSGRTKPHRPGTRLGVCGFGGRSCQRRCQVRAARSPICCDPADSAARRHRGN